MAEGLGSAELRLTVDDSAFNAGLRSAEQQAQQVGQKIQQSLSGAGSSIKPPTLPKDFLKFDAAGPSSAIRSIALLEERLQRLQATLNNTQIGSKGFRQLKQEIVDVQRELDKAKGGGFQFGEALSSGLRGIAGLAGIAGIGVLIQQIAATGQESERSKIQLKALTGAYGETAEAAESVARAQQVLGISAVEARSSFVGLFGALRGTGFGVREIEVLLVGFTKAARLSGAGAEQAAAGLLQLKQGLASGRFQGDELRSVFENLPVLAQEVAKKLGVNVGLVKQLGAEGKVSAAVVFEAAKSLALASAPGQTAVEQLGVAFKNAKEAAAEAFGPALVGIIKTASLGIQAFSAYVQENKGQLVSLAQGVLNFGKALLPIVIGIQAVRAALGAWALAGKAVAAAQALILSFSGPAGLLQLTAGAFAAAGALALIEGTLKAIGNASKDGFAKAREAVEEFKRRVEGAELQPGGTTTASPQALAAAAQLTQASQARLDAVQRAIGLEGEALQIAQQQLAVEEAKAIERQKFNAYNDAFKQANGDSNSEAVISAAAEYEDAANNVRTALISGAFAVGDSLNQATGNLNSALRGAFDILTFPEQKKLLEEARRNIQEAAKIGKVDPGKVDFRDPNAVLRAGEQSKAIVDAFKQVGAAQKEANAFLQANTEAVGTLAAKDWGVFVTVNADAGSVQVQGDAVNRSV